MCVFCFVLFGLGLVFQWMVFSVWGLRFWVSVWLWVFGVEGLGFEVWCLVFWV